MLPTRPVAAPIFAGTNSEQDLGFVNPEKTLLLQLILSACKPSGGGKLFPTFANTTRKPYFASFPLKI